MVHVWNRFLDSLGRRLVAELDNAKKRERIPEPLEFSLRCVLRDAWAFWRIVLVVALAGCLLFLGVMALAVRSWMPSEFDPQALRGGGGDDLLLHLPSVRWRLLESFALVLGTSASAVLASGAGLLLLFYLLFELGKQWSYSHIKNQTARRRVALWLARWWGQVLKPRLYRVVFVILVVGSVPVFVAASWQQAVLYTAVVLVLAISVLSLVWLVYVAAVLRQRTGYRNILLGPASRVTIARSMLLLFVILSVVNLVAAPAMLGSARAAMQYAAVPLTQRILAAGVAGLPADVHKGAKAVLTKELTELGRRVESELVPGLWWGVAPGVPWPGFATVQCALGVAYSVHVTLGYLVPFWLYRQAAKRRQRFTSALASVVASNLALAVISLVFFALRVHVLFWLVLIPIGTFLHLEINELEREHKWIQRLIK